MPHFRCPDKCSLFYQWQEISSSAAAVIFLNGTLQTSLNWKPFLEELKEKFNILCYDARGQGGSQLGEAPLSLSQHCQDLLNLMDFLAIHQANLVGISHGAYLSLYLNHVNPERVCGLLLMGIGISSVLKRRKFINSWIENLKKKGFEAMVSETIAQIFGKQFLQDNHHDLPSLIRAIVKRNDSKSVLAWLEAMIQYPEIEDFITHRSVPCRIISTAEDPLVSKEGAGSLAKRCGGNHQHLVRIGHSLPVENPNLFKVILNEFLLKR